MKLIVPFERSASPPKRFWSALWCKPGVQPEDPQAEFEAIRHSMVPGATDVVVDRKHAIGGITAGDRVVRALAAVGAWFVRREAAEREEQAAVMGGFDLLSEKSRLRDALRTRHVRM